tara:strand:- start:71 stop:517 length:447 start_codon:yes stop_codon:yes gene_type:complete
VIIRDIEEHEIGTLIDLYQHYTAPENLPPLSDAAIRDIWAAIQSSPGIRYFVLETEGRIVAAAILSITPSFIRGGAGYGLIEHVVTHADFRRRGLARALMEHVLDHAWAQGCSEVMLLSGADLTGAHRMYEGLGFDRHRRTGFIKYHP